MKNGHFSRRERDTRIQREGRPKISVEVDPASRAITKMHLSFDNDVISIVVRPRAPRSQT
jgi:hypothetical protein